MKKSSILIVVIAGIIAGFIIGTFMYPVFKGDKDVQKAEKKERKIMFYRHPMNPGVTSPTPQKDEMGMDYIPVYEEAAAKEEVHGTVRISLEKIQRIGVRSEVVKRRSLKRVIRTVGRVDPDERKVYNINAKIAGWVEKLYVNRTDQMVDYNEPLLELYSPELLSALFT